MWGGGRGAAEDSGLGKTRVGGRDEAPPRGSRRARRGVATRGPPPPPTRPSCFVPKRAVPKLGGKRLRGGPGPRRRAGNPGTLGAHFAGAPAVLATPPGG